MKPIKILSALLVILVSLNFAFALVVDSVIIDKELSPGEITELEIGLKNNGKKTIEDVIVSLDFLNLPFAPFDTSSEYGIDEITENKIKYANFKIIVLNTQSDIYKIPIKINYKEEDSPELITKTSLISIKVVSKPTLSVIPEESLLLKGRNNELDIKIINKGIGDIKFLEIEALPLNVNILSSSRVYIGDLDSDDFDTVSFKIFLKKEIPDKIIFPVKAKYKDSLNNEYSENFDLSLNTYTQEKAIGLDLIKKSYTTEIIILVVLLIVFYFLYRYVRRTLKK